MKKKNFLLSFFCCALLSVAAIGWSTVQNTKKANQRTQITIAKIALSLAQSNALISKKGFEASCLSPEPSPSEAEAEFVGPLRGEIQNNAQGNTCRISASFPDTPAGKSLRGHVIAMVFDSYGRQSRCETDLPTHLRPEDCEGIRQ